MENIKIRAIISIAIILVIWLIGDSFVYSPDGGAFYIAAIIGGGCFWIGSRPYNS